jgi:esterase/lipase superfamily enzyme
MNREYHHWYSERARREMELLWFGHAGVPYLVFPTSMGRFFDFEDRGMVETLRTRIEAGQLQLVCVDSMDRESWYNRRRRPPNRLKKHEAYEQYLLQEVLPLVRAKFPYPELGVTGASFGGYHAVNFALRHPDLVTHCISLSGAFDISGFVAGYYGEDVYYHNPVDYLPNLHDDWYLSRLRRQHLVLGAGGDDVCLDDNRRLSGILGARGIGHWLDVWNGWTHDWTLWRAMALKYW